ncbi:MAG TPA: PAS domain S-box protein [Ignavibacteriaceae bacterium]|nr:PAS domain S-box protein [Ignavibacteriaceae bacterium]
MDFTFSGKSKLEFQLLFDENPIPMMVYEDRTFKILAVNQAAINNYGYTKDEFLNLDAFQLRPKEDVEEFKEYLEQFKGNKGVGSYRHIKKNKEVIDVEIHANKINLGDNEVWLVAAYDVTKRKLAESRIAKLFKITRIVVASTQIDEAFENIYSIICKQEKWVAAELRLLNEKNEYVFESFWSINKHKKFFKQLFNDNCNIQFKELDNLISMRESVHSIKDLNLDDLIPYKDKLLNINIKTAHILPVLKIPDIKGIVIFYSEHSHKINRNSLIEIEAINQQLAFFIKKIKNRENLNQNKARLASIVDSAMDAIITIDEQHNILLFNHSAERIFLLDSSNAIGKPIDIIIPQRFRHIHRNQIEKFGATGSTARNMGALGTPNGLRSNGEEFPIEASISQINNGNEKLYTIILRDITERKKSEEQISASLREKEILLKEIHHRVKNNLQIISSLLNLQRAHIKDKEMGDIFNESQHRVKTMALIHEKLYKSNELSTIKFKDYVNELINYLLDSYDYKSEIEVHIDIDDVNVSLDVVVTLGLILNELVSNSIKHAFTNSKNGIIDVKFYLMDDGKISFIFCDNGVGFPPNYNFDDIQTLGNELIINLVDQLNGTIKYEFKNGTKVIMNFDLKEKLGQANN